MHKIIMYKISKVNSTQFQYCRKEINNYSLMLVFLATKNVSIFNYDPKIIEIKI